MGQWFSELIVLRPPEPDDALPDDESASDAPRHVRILWYCFRNQLKRQQLYKFTELFQQCLLKDHGIRATIENADGYTTASIQADKEIVAFILFDEIPQKQDDLFLDLKSLYYHAHEKGNLPVFLLMLPSSVKGAVLPSMDLSFIKTQCDLPGLDAPPFVITAPKRNFASIGQNNIENMAGIVSDTPSTTNPHNSPCNPTEGLLLYNAWSPFKIWEILLDSPQSDSDQRKEDLKIGYFLFHPEKRRDWDVDVFLLKLQATIRDKYSVGCDIKDITAWRHSSIRRSKPKFSAFLVFEEFKSDTTSPDERMLRAVYAVIRSNQPVMWLAARPSDSKDQPSLTFIKRVTRANQLQQPPRVFFVNSENLAFFEDITKPQQEEMARMALAAQVDDERSIYSVSMERQLHLKDQTKAVDVWRKDQKAYLQTKQNQEEEEEGGEEEEEEDQAAADGDEEEEGEKKVAPSSPEPVSAHYSTLDDFVLELNKPIEDDNVSLGTISKVSYHAPAPEDEDTESDTDRQDTREEPDDVVSIGYFLFQNKQDEWKVNDFLDQLTNTLMTTFQKKSTISNMTDWQQNEIENHPTKAFLVFDRARKGATTIDTDILQAVYSVIRSNQPVLWLLIRTQPLKGAFRQPAITWVRTHSKAMKLKQPPDVFLVTKGSADFSHFAKNQVTTMATTIVKAKMHSISSYTKQMIKKRKMNNTDTASSLYRARSRQEGDEKEEKEEEEEGGEEEEANDTPRRAVSTTVRIILDDDANDVVKPQQPSPVQIFLVSDDDEEEEEYMGSFRISSIRQYVNDHMDPGTAIMPEFIDEFIFMTDEEEEHIGAHVFNTSVLPSLEKPGINDKEMKLIKQRIVELADDMWSGSLMPILLFPFNTDDDSWILLVVEKIESRFHFCVYDPTGKRDIDFAADLSVWVVPFLIEVGLYSSERDMHELIANGPKPDEDRHNSGVYVMYAIQQYTQNLCFDRDAPTAEVGPLREKFKEQLIQRMDARKWIGSSIDVIQRIQERHYFTQLMQSLRTPMPLSPDLMDEFIKMKRKEKGFRNIQIFPTKVMPIIMERHTHPREYETNVGYYVNFYKTANNPNPELLVFPVDYRGNCWFLLVVYRSIEKDKEKDPAIIFVIQSLQTFEPPVEDLLQYLTVFLEDIGFFAEDQLYDVHGWKGPKQSYFYDCGFYVTAAIEHIYDCLAYGDEIPDIPDVVAVRTQLSQAFEDRFARNEWSGPLHDWSRMRDVSAGTFLPEYTEEQTLSSAFVEHTKDSEQYIETLIDSTTGRCTQIEDLRPGMLIGVDDKVITAITRTYKSKTPKFETRDKLIFTQKSRLRVLRIDRLPDTTLPIDCFDDQVYMPISKYTTTQDAVLPVAWRISSAFRQHVLSLPSLSSHQIKDLVAGLWIELSDNDIPLVGDTSSVLITRTWTSPPGLLHLAVHPNRTVTKNTHLLVLATDDTQDGKPVRIKVPNQHFLTLDHYTTSKNTKRPSVFVGGDLLEGVECKWGNHADDLSDKDDEKIPDEDDEDFDVVDDDEKKRQGVYSGFLWKAFNKRLRERIRDSESPIKTLQAGMWVRSNDQLGRPVTQRVLATGYPQDQIAASIPDLHVLLSGETALWQLNELQIVGIDPEVVKGSELTLDQMVPLSKPQDPFGIGEYTAEERTLAPDYEFATSRYHNRRQGKRAQKIITHHAERHGYSGVDKRHQDKD